MKKNLTNAVVNSLKPSNKPFEIRDTQIPGLLLRVQPSGVMAYYLEYKRGSRRNIGRANVLTIFQARERAKQILSRVYSGQNPSDKNHETQTKTLAIFLAEDYSPWLISNLRGGEVTCKRLVSAFPELQAAKLHEITPWLVEQWKIRRQKEGLKASSINRLLADLKACLARATAWNIIDKDPLLGFKLLKLDTSPSIRFLSNQEEKAIRQHLDLRESRIRQERETANRWREERAYPLFADLDGAFADHLKPAVLLSLNTGMRRGELLGLRWENVDLVRKMLTVEAATAKTNKTRHIPLNDEAIVVLQGWEAQSQSKNGYVFENVEGKPMHDVRASWKKVLEAAGVKDFRWHDLRHTFASNLVMAGVELNTVRELLGHSNYSMTLRYSHLAPAHKASAVAKLLNRGVV